MEEQLKKYIVKLKHQIMQLEKKLRREKEKNQDLANKLARKQ